MVEAQPSRRTVATTALRVLIVFDTTTFLLMAALHLGPSIPLGFTELATGRIIAAAVVEGLAGLLFTLCIAAMLVRASWAWAATLIAHIFALAGVLLGIAVIAAGTGPHNALNDGYHRLMVALLVVGLLILWTPAARDALGQGGQSKERARSR